MSAMPTNQARKLVEGITPYQVFMLALCVWALITLSASAFLPLDPSTKSILLYADTFVCGLFFVDFLYTLYRAPRKGHYLMTWGWIDLLSSIPAIDSLRWGRAVRIMRIVRVLRGVKSARTLAQFLVSRRAESALLATMLLSILILVVTSVAILQFEADQGGANIVTAEDALWWAMTTMTTVGYGDRYPTTTEGRIIAAFLMAAGVGVFGTFSGLIASWFLSPAAEETDDDLTEVKAQLTTIQKQLEEMNTKLGQV
jgi:voltage-gated potassium channel